MMRKALLALAFGLAASCVHAQTAPSPADVGISKGTPDVFKFKGSDNVWTPFGSVDPSTHIFAPATNGSIAPNDCLKWGPGITSAGAPCGSGGGGGGGGATLYTSHSGLVNNVTTPTGASTVEQQGFYAPGDGGAATYQWSAGSYCGTGTSGSPVNADGVICVLPIGQSPSTAGRYLFQASGSIDVRAVGMQPGGADNSSFVQTLMNAVSKPGPYTAATIVIPPVLGQNVTPYYFSQPFVLARGVTLDCKSSGVGGYASTVLVFPPGVDGVRQETSYLSDGGDGVSVVKGCGISSLGGGHGQAGYFTYILPGATVSNGGSGYAGTAGTMTWNVPGYCTTNPVLNVSASGGVVTAVTGVANGGVCQSEIYNGPGWTAGGGLSGGSGASFSVVHNAVATTNSVNNVGLDRASAVTGWTSFPATCGAQSGTHACTVGVGDGIVMLPAAPQPSGAPLTAPGAYVGTSNPATGAFTFASPYTITGSLGGSANVALWDLPASQAYTIQTTATSNIITVTGGPRLLRPGDMVWSDAFLFGSSVAGMNNAIVGTPTVNTGGSGFTGTSGTMTWSGPGCGGFGHSPVLNVTASGGVITGVSSVADAGNCEAATPSPSATTWTAGGGLSGGSGASFNTVWNQTAWLRSVTLYPDAPALVTHTSGAPGKLWVMPTGIKRRIQSRTDSNTISGFGFGLDVECQGNTDPATGCNSSFDKGNTFLFNMIGRLVRGNNSANGNSTDNIYADSSIADTVEAASLGSSYFNEENNSEEDSTAFYDVLVQCGTENFSTFYGSYMSGQPPESCLGRDAQGNYNIGVQPTIGDSALFMGGLFGGPQAPSIGIGFLAGHWSFFGPSSATVVANIATASGTNIAFPTSNIFRTGQTITDLTNAVIPPNTTIVFSTVSGAVISNALTGGGIQIGDQLQIAGPNPCIRVNAGMEIDGANGMIFSGDCAGVGMQIALNGYDNSWEFNNVMKITGFDYLGYAGNGDRKAVFPLGFEIGPVDASGYIGQERLIDGGPTVPTAAWHLQGDARINSTPTSGSNWAWVNVPVFTTTLSAPVTIGVTTSVAVAACPSPALPAGTPVIDFTGTVTNTVLSNPLGTLSSCSGTTLTLQAAATNSAPSGHTIQFMQWRPAARIANDTAGTSWPVATPVAIASLTPCNASAVGFGVVTNGVAVGTGGYGAAVSATGAVTRPVFCDGASWTYH